MPNLACLPKINSFTWTNEGQKLDCLNPRGGVFPLGEIRKALGREYRIPLDGVGPGSAAVTGMSEHFSFEKLEVYQLALDWAEQSELILRDIGDQVSRPFVDQLSRAALSIPLSIAEGNGRWHKVEKRSFFWVARGSVFKCVPLIEILHRKRLVSEIDAIAHRTQLVVLGEMLTNLVKAPAGG